MKDICKRKHKGNKESKAANPSKSHKDTLRKQIYEHFLLNDKLIGNGFTSKELAKIFTTELNCISGRLSELKEMGLIYATDMRRDGCAVLKIK